MSIPPDAALEVVLTCTDLEAMTAFMTESLGCRIELVSPADDPAEVVFSGHGATIRVCRAATDVAGHLRLSSDRIPAGDRRESLVAPNGTFIELVSASTAIVLPDNEPSLSIVRSSPDDAFGSGRAGMGYRDLLPDRWGGRFIASHIRIAEGGDVADYVHFHRIRFQMIFVASGWVDVVYEDQGPPFRLHRGDCVLQPPEIRHRVLRCSPGLEVIEIGCPARHDTVAEHSIELPTPSVSPDRDFGGQRFVRHVAADIDPVDAGIPGFTARDTGIALATGALAGARVLAASAASDDMVHLTHDGEFAMMVVLAGSADFGVRSEPSERLSARDAVAIPAGMLWSWSGWTEDFEALEVTLPAGACRPVAGPTRRSPRP